MPLFFLTGGGFVICLQCQSTMLSVFTTYDKTSLYAGFVFFLISSEENAIPLLLKEYFLKIRASYQGY